MSNFLKKNDQVIISPDQIVDYFKTHGGAPDIKIPECLIMCYQHRLFDFILKNHPTTQIKGRFPNLHIINETQGRVAVIGNFGIGASNAANMLEMLIAFGVKKIISLGTAGTLQHSTNVGDIVVCNKAIAEEGVSPHYFENCREYFPSEELTKELEKHLVEQKCTFKIGATWTTDAPYRETIAKTKKFQEEKVETVEMEASALFAICNYRGVEIASLFSISDSLASLKWEPGFHHKSNQATLNKIFLTAMLCLENY
jgi:purine-nucleoside phosphorylase